jgi:hypothetical protein
VAADDRRATLVAHPSAGVLAPALALLKDQMTCAAITPDDLVMLFNLVALYALLIGFLGMFLHTVVAAVGRWADRAIRMRALREPFGVRARRMEAMRARLLVSLDRICERNAREAARRG